MFRHQLIINNSLWRRIYLQNPKLLKAQLYLKLYFSCFFFVKNFVVPASHKFDCKNAKIRNGQRLCYMFLFTTRASSDFNKWDYLYMKYSTCYNVIFVRNDRQIVPGTKDEAIATGSSYYRQCNVIDLKALDRSIV